MLFNSIEFLFFMPLVFILFWMLQHQLKWQNLFITVASLVFYGWWDYRFLGLIMITVVSNYVLALAINNQDQTFYRRLLLWIGLLLNFGILTYYKYFNFFIDAFTSLSTALGFQVNVSSLEVILPVGISFYTFQTLSYTIDVYKRKLEPTRNFVDFTGFVSFFPQLVAGPIERATHLLPQFYFPKRFTYAAAVLGGRLILIGLFKKVVIADNCAPYADYAFDHYETLGGSGLFLGAFFFTFQIYGDFSGYSDIAIGCARLFGFTLMDNFRMPYLSRNVSEFWRRWHISLSTWFRDYVYIPLGGNQGTALHRNFRVFVVFLVSGFWHGANWTFIAWGLVNALFILPANLLESVHARFKRIQPDMPLTFRHLPAILLTFSITCLIWVFFRADTLHQAFMILKGIFSPSLFTVPDIQNKKIIAIIALWMGFEWGMRNTKSLGQLDALIPFKLLRWAFYMVLVWFVMFYGGSQQAFIYFQF